MGVSNAMVKTQLIYKILSDSPVNKIIVTVCAALTIIYCISVYLVLPGFEVFAHDVYHYQPNITYKLAQEGRWVDFILQDFSRSISLQTWAIILPITGWALFYRLASLQGFDIYYSALISSTILLSPAFVHLALWPDSAYLSIFVLLAVSLLRNINVSYPTFYVISGILLFGVLPTWYFILPLFYLKQFIATPNSDQAHWSLLLKHIFWWITGSLVGVLSMSTIVWIIIGQFGIEPAAWRQIQPAHSLNELFRNILISANNLWYYFAKLTHIANTNNGLFIICMVTILALRIRSLISSRYAILLIVVVGVSFFVFCIPLAPIIQMRSVIALVTALVFFIALLAGMSFPGRVLGALLMLWISYSFSIEGEAYLSTQKSEKTFFYQKLQELLPRSPASYKAIALFGTMDHNLPEAKIFNNKIGSYMAALGVRTYIDCRKWIDKPICKDLGGLETTSVLPFVNGRLNLSVSNDNIAVIHYLE